MYWEQLTCYIDGPLFNTIQVGENATGIVCWAEYYYWASHGYRYYTGTLTLNDTTYLYETPGIRAYRVASAAGDDEWGVVTIRSSQVTACSWQAQTTSTTTTTGTTTTTTTTTQNPWGLYIAVAGIGIAGVALVLVVVVARRLRSATREGVPEDLDTALDYLDSIAAEQGEDPEDNT
jgi:hypothetical protein